MIGRPGRFAIGCVGVICLVGTALFASNMLFKLQRSLIGPQPNPALPLGVTSGTKSLALPYIPQAGLTDAASLLDDINAETNGAAVQVARYVRTADAAEFYTGVLGTNFSLVPGEGYLLKVSTDSLYTIAGSHDPALSVNLLGPKPNASPGGLSFGQNLYSHPFHAVASTANELRQEIGTASVLSVGRWVESLDGIATYNGYPGQTDFPLIPGHAYFITVNTDVSFVPAHY